MLLRKISIFTICLAAISQDLSAKDNLFFKDDNLVNQLQAINTGSLTINRPGPSKDEIKRELENKIKKTLQQQMEEKLRNQLANERRNKEREIQNRVNTQTSELRTKLEREKEALRQEIKAKLEQEIKEEQEQKEKDRLATLPDEIKAFKLGNYYLNSVMFTDQNNWTVWLNGKEYISSKEYDDVKIINVSAYKVALLFKQDHIKHYKEYFAEKMQKSAEDSFWDYSSEDGNVLVNLENNIIRVVLELNKQFKGHELAITDNKKGLAEVMSVTHPDKPANTAAKEAKVKESKFKSTAATSIGNKNAPVNRSWQQNKAKVNPVPAIKKYNNSGRESAADRAKRLRERLKKLRLGQ